MCSPFCKEKINGVFEGRRRFVWARLTALLGSVNGSVRDVSQFRFKSAGLVFRDGDRWIGAKECVALAGAFAAVLE